MGGGVGAYHYLDAGNEENHNDENCYFVGGLMEVEGGQHTSEDVVDLGMWVVEMRMDTGWQFADTGIHKEEGQHMDMGMGQVGLSMEVACFHQNLEVDDEEGTVDCRVGLDMGSHQNSGADAVEGMFDSGVGSHKGMVVKNRADP